MRVERATGLTDPGRKRRHNEDAFVCEPPLFAVADGMGGAQAGELASRLAAASVGRSEPDGRTGRERVVSLIEDANRSVYERAAEDESVSGMGTTMTVALVEGDRVWIGHVGDSRAYLVREALLEQITDDHSLVAELVRSGRLDPDEAGSHPHRSVITRALGTDADVAVDALAVPSQPQDVFMLCSDGLTTMVSDERIREIVEQHRPDLEAAARALVDEANAAGGEDNITVVLFEIADADVLAAPSAERDLGRDDEDTLHGVASPFTETVADATPAGPASRRRPRSGPVVAATAAVVLVFGALAVFGLSRAHFVGVEEDGHVAVYQGVPWDLGLGVRLYRLVYESPLLAANLSQAERRRLFDHNLESRDAAVSAVQVYAQDVVP
jgi:serine/threonine protein phosphatase PrpC